MAYHSCALQVLPIHRIDMIISLRIPTIVLGRTSKTKIAQHTTQPNCKEWRSLQTWSGHSWVGRWGFGMTKGIRVQRQNQNVTTDKLRKPPFVNSLKVPYSKSVVGVSLVLCRHKVRASGSRSSAGIG